MENGRLCSIKLSLSANAVLLKLWCIFQLIESTKWPQIIHVLTISMHSKCFAIYVVLYLMRGVYDTLQVFNCVEHITNVVYYPLRVVWITCTHYRCFVSHITGVVYCAIIQRPYLFHHFLPSFICVCESSKC